MRNNVFRAIPERIEVIVIETITTLPLLFVVAAGNGKSTNVALLWTPVWTREILERAKLSSCLHYLKAAVNRHLCSSQSVLADIQKKAEARPC